MNDNTTKVSEAEQAITLVKDKAKSLLCDIVRSHCGLVSQPSLLAFQADSFVDLIVSAATLEVAVMQREALAKAKAPAEPFVPSMVFKVPQSDQGGWTEILDYQTIDPRKLQDTLGVVEVRLRDGTTVIGLPIQFDWHDDGGNKDIMAYRKFTGKIIA